ncbi:MAG: AsmA-like C-terminal region-containing protein [Hyphomicrobiaceae bacterium]
MVPLAVLGAGLVYVKLLFGAIPLHFLVEPVRQALLAELDDVDVTIADAALHRSPAGGFEVRLIDVSLAARRGDTAVRASEAVVGLDLAALRSGRIAADRIVLIGPRLNLTQEAARLSGFTPSDGAADRSPGHNPPAAPATTDGGAISPIDQSHRIDLARAIAEAVTHLRQGRKVASQLRVFGLRDARLEVDDHGRRTTWHVAEMEVALDHHRKHSVIKGAGRVSAGGMPFGVTFSVDQSEKTGALKLATTIDGLSLPALARNVPHLGLLAALDAPVTARGETELTSDGVIVSGRFDVDLGRGSVLPEALGGHAIGIDGGKLQFVYDGEKRRLELAPSKVQLDGSWVRVKGDLTPVTATGDAVIGWQLDLASIDGELAETPDRPATRIDELTLRARLWPTSGASELLSFVFKAGGADLQAHGTMVGGEQRSARLEGRIGPMNATTMKAFWPEAISPGLRSAVQHRLVKGNLKEGTFRLSAGQGDAPAGIALSLEAEDLAVLPAPDLPPITIPHATLTREGERLELTVPEAQLLVAPNRRVTFKTASIVITGIDKERPEAEITGRAQSTLATVVDVMTRDSIGLLTVGQVPAGADGKVEVQWRATLPLVEGVSFADSNLDAKVRLTDGRIPNIVGAHDVTGAAFTIGATERAIDLKGEFLLAGILAKANGQWLLGENAERQSPIVITTQLDSADRRRLGLTIDDLIQGEVPVEVQVTPGVGDEHGKIVFNADLTPAELSFTGLSWHKPAGRTARLSFEVVRPRGAKTMELQEFRLSGDSITINGTVVLGADGRPISYRFPGFSLNVVSNLEVEGNRRSDKVWDVKARGKTFDGTAVMRSLYAFEAEKKKLGTDEPMDLDARIDTVIGHNDTTVRQVRLKLKRRNDHVVDLEMTGTLDGGELIEARMQSVQDGMMRVQTRDAGQALKTIGFYASMVGGNGTLWVDLDGSVGVERSGQIQINKFRVLGDSVVNELVQGVDESRPAIATGKERPSRRVVREEIAFDTLRGSFATGNGQVAIESLTAAGPLIGASVRGKMDFRNHSVSLGGTYVPLSGLNRVLAGIPIFGELLTGPRKDGVIGITFAVDGPMGKPNVIINPLSMVAPGVLREIFQMVPENPRVTPADGAAPFSGGGPRARSSPPDTHRQQKRPTGDTRVLDGWSSQSSSEDRR